MNDRPAAVSNTDSRVVLSVTIGLVLVIVGGLGGAILLSNVGKPTPDLVSDAVKVALGALSALLASTASRTAGSSSTSSSAGPDDGLPPLDLSKLPPLPPMPGGLPELK